MTVLAELGDVTRFGSARQLMSYLGLTPSEHGSGARQRRGPITKTGNSHVRRILVESAWHYRHPPRVGRELRKRGEGQPGWAVALADRADPAPPPPPAAGHSRSLHISCWPRRPRPSQLRAAPCPWRPEV